MVLVMYSILEFKMERFKLKLYTKGLKRSIDTNKLMTVTNQKMNCKKKRTRFYEIYIAKLLKQVSAENGITSNSKQQLNSILCSITRLISTRVNELTEIAKKKTMSEKEVINALYILFPAELGKGMVAMCDQSVENYGINHDTRNSKGITRQERAQV